MSEDRRFTCVLDASALLAYLHEETGHESVASALSGSLICSVNWSEVVQKSVAHGVAPDGLRGDLAALGLAVVPFSAEDAELAATLWPATRVFGLSLGDRACLALARQRRLPAFTTDRIWGELAVNIEIRVIR